MANKLLFILLLRSIKNGFVKYPIRARVPEARHANYAEKGYLCTRRNHPDPWRWPGNDEAQCYLKVINSTWTFLAVVKKGTGRLVLASLQE